MNQRPHKVLVLNADYRAFSIVSIYKAFLLVYLEKAEVVRKSEHFVLRTVSRAFEAPSVIRLLTYVNMPYKGVMLSRQNIYKRDSHACVYCGAKDNLTLDHVLPRSRGGKTSWTNLVTACRSCNTRKGDFLPEEIGMTLPFQPYKPSFVVFLRNYSGLPEDAWQPYISSTG